MFLEFDGMQLQGVTDIMDDASAGRGIEQIRKGSEELQLASEGLRETVSLIDNVQSKLSQMVAVGS